jgi:type I restriction enzyme S subunit
MSEINIPEGWASVKLGSIVRVSSGVGFPKKYQGKPTGIYPVYKVGDISQSIVTNNGDLTHANHHVDVEQANELKGEVFSEGTTLFAKIGEAVKLNRRAFVLKPGLADNNVMAVLPHKEEFNRFIYHFMRTVDLSDISRSTTVPSIRKGDIEDLAINLPPIAEQTVISKKLDTLLAQVETTKARLERIPEILKTFRQSVLAAAVSGKLTEEWRLVNGLGKKQFTEEIELTEFRGRKLATLPVSWQWLRFDQVAEIASNLVSPLDNPDSIHIAPNHIESWTGIVSNFQTISDDGVTSAKHRFTKGQIIYSKIRPYLAKVAIAEFDGLCSADMYPVNSQVNTKFLFRWMLTSEFTDWASNAESRSVLPKINQKDLNKIPVPTPPIKEQAEIVQRIEDLFTFAESIEQKANAALDRVNNLTQTILAKAFRGELTADWRAANHELITGENSGEALLEKIKAERKAITPEKKAASRKKA